MLNKILSVALGCVLVNSIFAEPIKTESIKQETPTFIIDVKYPQGFSEAKVDGAIKQYIDETQKSFLNELSEDEDTPADAPGKTGLNVGYTVLYDAKSALSVRFDVSIYHKGAAHPLNTVVIQNFYKDEKILLADLFMHNTNYLTVLAGYCKKAITGKKISDPKWIDEGTKATVENYSVWYFTNKGVAYVYGDQTVELPLSAVSSLMKPELVKAVWSN